METIVDFKNITLSYPGEDLPVFKDFSLSIGEGEFILMTGRSGVGKTTFIRLLLRELIPDSGRIYVRGEDITSIPERELSAYRRRVGVVFQDFKLLKDRTVYDNLDLTRYVTGGSRKDTGRRIASIMSMLGIDYLFRRKPQELSGGEQQKVCIARALMNAPTILLADEPTGNLDPGSSREIMELFEIIHKSGITVITATHNISQAEGLTCREIQLPLP